MSIYPKLFRALTSINFLDRFERLRGQFNKFPDFPFRADPKIVKQKIENFGYQTKYYRSESFFKIWRPGRSDQQLHLSVTQNKAEFILNITIDGHTNGSPYTGCAIDLSTEEQNAAREYPHARPRFKNYDELYIILSAGFDLFDDLVKALDDIQNAEG